MISSTSSFSGVAVCRVLSLQRTQAKGNGPEVWGTVPRDWHRVAWTLNYLGDLARESVDSIASRSYYEQSLSFFRQLGDGWGIASALSDLAMLSAADGHHRHAETLYGESMKIFRDLGHKRGIARVLECFAVGAAAQFRPQQALRLAGAAAALRQRIGTPLIPAEQSRLEKKLEPARNMLTLHSFADHAHLFSVWVAPGTSKPFCFQHSELWHWSCYPARFTLAGRGGRMKIRARMLLLLALALFSFLMTQVPAANADIIEYKVTGVGPDLGTNFTFISTFGFVTAGDFPLVPTTATDLFVGGVDEGAITSIVLTDAGQQLEYLATSGDFVFVSNAGGINFPTATGTFSDSVGSTLTGTGVVTDLSTVPEPGSITLLLTGLLSLGLLVMRTRAARALS